VFGKRTRLWRVVRDEMLNKLQVRVLSILEDLRVQNRRLEAARERDIITLQESIMKNTQEISHQAKKLQEDAVSESLTMP
jgi:hypothetical protein